MSKSSSVLLLAGLPIVLGACAGKNEQPKQDPLIASLREDRIKRTCSDDAYERVCFAIDAGVCRSAVGKHYDACVSDEHLESSSDKSPTEIGTTLGTCTENRVLKEFAEIGKPNREGRCAKTW